MPQGCHRHRGAGLGSGPRRRPQDTCRLAPCRGWSVGPDLFIGTELSGKTLGIVGRTPRLMGRARYAAASACTCWPPIGAFLRPTRWHLDNRAGRPPRGIRRHLGARGSQSADRAMSRARVRPHEDRLDLHRTPPGARLSTKRPSFTRSSGDLCAAQVWTSSAASSTRNTPFVPT